MGKSSVVDPDPNRRIRMFLDLKDPYHYLYGSGSNKIGRKTLISTVFFYFCMTFFSLKNDVIVPPKSNKQKNLYF